MSQGDARGRAGEDMTRVILTLSVAPNMTRETAGQWAAVLIDDLIAACAEPEAVEQGGVPWHEGPAACTNCGEPAHAMTYADFVGPFCEGCWDRLREHFTPTPSARVLPSTREIADAGERKGGR